MSTSIRTVNTIRGFWSPVSIEANTSAITSQPNQYYILSFPEINQIIVMEEEKNEYEDELSRLFAEFAEEDIEMAEMRMDEYNKILLIEDEE